jgi:hypothetical protein
MISILEKIGKAIDCSRRASDLVITEDQQATTRKLFISGTMDNDTLQLWGKILMPKISGSPLLMKAGMISTPQESPVRSTLSPSSAMNPGILRLFTLEGWRTFLLQDPRLRQYHRICALFVNESFETQQWKVVPWKQMLPEESETDVPAGQPPSQKALSGVFQPTFFLRIPLPPGS